MLHLMLYSNVDSVVQFRMLIVQIEFVAPLEIRIKHKTA